MVREIEDRRASTSDFYEELRTHASVLADGSTTKELDKKQVFKRIGVIIDELKERYWELTDLLAEVSGIEIIQSSLPDTATQLSHEIIEILKQMEPTVRNAHKSLRSNELGTVATDLVSVVENKKFIDLNNILVQLSEKIAEDSGKLEDLRQKRIM
jgi:hypothetical protein